MSCMQQGTIDPAARQLPAEFSLASREMAERAFTSSEVDVMYLGKVRIFGLTANSREKWSGTSGLDMLKMKPGVGILPSF